MKIINQHRELLCLDVLIDVNLHTTCEPLIVTLINYVK